MPERRTPLRPLRIAAFGDSLSAGYGLPPADGFAPALQNTLARLGLAATVFCAAVSGDTSADGLARTGEMLAQTPDIVVVEFGYNDLYYGGAVAATRKNLSQILARILQTDARVLLAGVHSPPGTPPQTQNEFAKMYETLRDEFAAPLYPSFLAGVASNSSLLLPDDDVHPSAAGARIVASNIAPMILQIADEMRGTRAHSSAATG